MCRFVVDVHGMFFSFQFPVLKVIELYQYIDVVANFFVAEVAHGGP